MKLASIETITEIRAHPNADRLELAKVLGWQTIVKKGEFKVGDNIVFVPIDTILPDAPWSAFLKKGDSPIRLRTIKLRGEYSQGLVLPRSVLPECAQSWHVGADVGGELGIRKFEKEIPACLSGVMRSTFPTFLVSKTDEDNGLSHPAIVAEVLRRPVSVTQKLDGSSCTIIVENGIVTHVCSRNMSLEESETNAFWKVARKGNWAGFTGVVQGELMGPGVQGNQLGLTEPTLYVFQIREEGRWNPPDKAFMLGYQRVPFLGVLENATLEELQRIADEQKLPNGEPAEGVVVRPTDYPASGVGRPLGFKIINRNYGE